VAHEHGGAYSRPNLGRSTPDEKPPSEGGGPLLGSGYVKVKKLLRGAVSLVLLRGETFRGL